MKKKLIIISNISGVIAMVLAIVELFVAPLYAYFLDVMFLIACIPTAPLLITTKKAKWSNKKWYIVYIIITSIYLCILLLSPFNKELIDLPYAIRKEYVVINGNVNMYKTNITKGGTHQIIMIDREEYINNSTRWQKIERTGIYTLKCLPNSKIVMEIIGPLSEPLD